MAGLMLNGLAAIVTIALRVTLALGLAGALVLLVLALVTRKGR